MLAALMDPQPLEDQLPPCGIYKTREPIGTVPAGRLVYFHNHGSPGPGIYLPEGWHLNRAFFRENGETMEEHVVAGATLEPLMDEGLYRVEEEFTCCSNHCRVYPEGLLVQLGYNGMAQAILFVPEWTELGLAFPEIGQLVEQDRLAKLSPLVVPEAEEEPVSEEVH